MASCYNYKLNHVAYRCFPSLDRAGHRDYGHRILPETNIHKNPVMAFRRAAGPFAVTSSLFTYG